MDRLKTFLLLFVSFSMKSAAQNTIRISYTDGNISEIPIGQIDSISFIEKDDGALEGVLPGTTYVEKYISGTNSIFAYKVIVE